jgi:hypothetical protein
MDKELEIAIDKCLELSKQNNDIAFVFKKDTGYGDDSESEYIVSDITMMENYPSRVPIYDSQFKQLNKYRKFDRVYSVISKLGFNPSVSNLGEKYEQVFTRQIDLNNEKSILNLRLQPNLFCRIDYLSSDGLMSPYKGYFEYNRIYSSLAHLEDINLKQFLRDIVIDEILA